jgi:hypothetical protein
VLDAQADLAQVDQFGHRGIRCEVGEILHWLARVLRSIGDQSLPGWSRFRIQAGD